MPIPLTIRAFEFDLHYPVLAGFWKGHGWDAPPPEAIPPEFFVVESNGELVAAEGLYVVEANHIGAQEWLVSNPDAPANAIVSAMSLLDATIQERAEELGLWAVFSYVQQPSLAKFRERNGHTRTDEGMIHFVKTIKSPE